MGWLTIDVANEVAEMVRKKAKGRGQSVETYLAELVSIAMAATESTMENQNRQQPSKHPTLAAKLLDKAARLRATAREFENEPPPPVPGNDKTETFAKLWAEAWRQECGMVADRLGDAAKILEEAASGISPTHDLVNWRR